MHEATTSNMGLEGASTTFPALAHSVPGGAFDTRDAASRAYLERHCAALPGAGLPRRRGPHRDDVATGHALVCARRHGVPESKLLAELAPACPTFTDDLDSIEDPEKVPDTAPCPRWWQRWLEAER
jgi:hypothetical protein